MARWRAGFSPMPLSFPKIERRRALWGRMASCAPVANRRPADLLSRDLQAGCQQLPTRRRFDNPPQAPHESDIWENQVAGLQPGFSPRGTSVPPLCSVAEATRGLIRPETEVVREFHQTLALLCRAPPADQQADQQADTCLQAGLSSNVTDCERTHPQVTLMRSHASTDSTLFWEA